VNGLSLHAVSQYHPNLTAAVVVRSLVHSQNQDEADADAALSAYQLDMMRCLREVNVDNNTVGWYQSSVLGSYQTQEMIDTFISYHDSIKKYVGVVWGKGGQGSKGCRGGCCPYSGSCQPAAVQDLAALYLSGQAGG
jgi:hypothetical protein